MTRMVDVAVGTARFSRREIPDEFGKKYIGIKKVLRFKVLEMTDELQNRFPAENFTICDGETYLQLKVKASEDGNNIQERFRHLTLL